MSNEKRLDLIDRGALGIGIANPLVFDKTEYAHGWNCAIEIIQNAPTVDAVEVVHGRWERMVGMMPPEYHGRHECSCCGVKALDWKFHEYLSNYCPNCGAKMDGGVKNA